MKYITLDKYVEGFRSATAASLELGVTSNTVISNTGESGTAIVILGDDFDTLLTQLNRSHRISGDIVSVCELNDALRKSGGNKTVMADKTKCNRKTLALLISDERKAALVQFENGEHRIVREVGC